MWQSLVYALRNYKKRNHTCQVNLVRKTSNDEDYSEAHFIFIMIATVLIDLSIREKSFPALS